jgi:glycosyltransferase involved in cell wall biosynthesis
MNADTNNLRTTLEHISQRIIVVRGDLYSDTGYAQATRALCTILRKHCDRLLGLSIHDHIVRRLNAFDFPVIRTRDLLDLRDLAGALVVNVCLPDEFLHNVSTFNIGYFFWETEKPPIDRSWKVHMSLMDRLWAPSHWQSRYIQNLMGGIHIPVVPWPQVDVKQQTHPDPYMLSCFRSHPAMLREQLHNFLIRSAPPGFNDRAKRREYEEFTAGINNRFNPSDSPSLSDILQRGGDTYLAVQTDAPRKGLSLLLNCWLLFKRCPEARDAKLIVKLSSLDVDADLFRLHFHSSLALSRATERIGVNAPDVWFVYDRFDAAQFNQLLSSCDAYITATMGEGFGGPLAEALIHEVPVIAPAHTSCGDILGTDYALAVQAEPHVLALWNNISLYSPSSIWHVVEDASFVECLQRFTAMSSAERRHLALTAKQHLLQRTGIKTVESIIATELHSIFPGR